MKMWKYVAETENGRTHFSSWWIGSSETVSARKDQGSGSNHYTGSFLLYRKLFHIDKFVWSVYNETWISEHDKKRERT